MVLPKLKASASAPSLKRNASQGRTVLHNQRCSQHDSRVEEEKRQDCALKRTCTDGLPGEVLAQTTD